MTALIGSASSSYSAQSFDPSRTHDRFISHLRKCSRVVLHSCVALTCHLQTVVMKQKLNGGVSARKYFLLTTDALRDSFDRLLIHSRSVTVVPRSIIPSKLMLRIAFGVLRGHAHSVFFAIPSLIRGECLDPSPTGTWPTPAAAKVSLHRVASFLSEVSTFLLLYMLILMRIIGGSPRLLHGSGGCYSCYQPKPRYRVWVCCLRVDG